MKRLTATEAARRFSEMLDAVEDLGETFVVVRNGRSVAQVGPVPAGHGAMVKDALRAQPRDAGWIDELRTLRSGLSRDGRG
jgi:antitoxin (DNA-binding transcriptional repressor) of toxin-antitoxin stability system